MSRLVPFMVAVVAGAGMLLLLAGATAAHADRTLPASRAAATPSPTPTASATEPSPSDKSKPKPSKEPKPSQQPEEPGGISGLITDAINGWLVTVVKSVIKPAISLLGKTLMTSPRVDLLQDVRTMWTGSVAIANTAFVLFVVAGGLSLMGHETFLSSYTVKDIAPRLLVGVVAANLSLELVGGAVTIANALSAALMGQNVNPEAAANRLGNLLSSSVNEGFGMMLVLGLATVIMIVWLVVILVIRVMMLILLTAAAPVMLACHALPQTEGLATFWWRAFGTVLGIQVAHALVMIAGINVFLTPDRQSLFFTEGSSDTGGTGLVDLSILICLLYVLIRIPSWISRALLRGQLGSSPMSRVAKIAVTYLIFRRVLGRRSAAATTSTRRTPSTPAPGPARPQLPPRRPTPALPPGARDDAAAARNAVQHRAEAARDGTRRRAEQGRAATADRAAKARAATEHRADVGRSATAQRADNARRATEQRAARAREAAQDRAAARRRARRTDQDRRNQ